MTPISAPPTEWRAIPAAMSDLFDGIDPVAFAAALALLHADDPYLDAARLAIEIADGRRAHLRVLREVGRDVHGGDRAYWRDFAANHVPFEELQRRRGVEIDPDGRPRSARRGAA